MAQKTALSASEVLILIDELGRDWGAFAAALSDDGTDIDEGNSRNAEGQCKHLYTERKKKFPAELSTLQSHREHPPD